MWLRRLHPAAGGTALAVIACFWLATVGSEIFGDRTLIATVKTSIPWGFLLLLPCLAAAGLSGRRLAGRRRHTLIEAKRRRTLVAAGNGLLVLMPCAFALAFLAASGDFGTPFYGIQAVELVAGALNIALLGLNIRDGHRLHP
ncbi:hypothetical protein [Zavarzinia sp.]|uniref:hypothetical protein n=1 Tax=Zavarzinia sp. TaxID=2027920 RepID=UPI0035620BDB